jgi:hypothetical protein
MERRHRVNFGKQGKHSELPLMLQNMTWNPAAVSVGINLARIVPQRVAADYKTLAPFNHRNCQLLIRTADQIIQDVQRVP